MSTDDFVPMTIEELAAEGVTALPDKEVVSILDLAADIDLAIDGAAPIDLAIALNANVVAPIDAAVSANLLSNGSTSQALADQGVVVNQTVDADAIATGIQDSTIDQSDTVTDGTGAAPADDAGGEPAMMAASADAGDARWTLRPLPPRQPVDGAVVVDSAGNILGTLDESTRDRGRLRRRHRRHPQRDHRDWWSTRPAPSSARSPTWSTARRSPTPRAPSSVSSTERPAP